MSEINARAIAGIPAMVKVLREAESCLNETNENERRSLQEIQKILSRIFVDTDLNSAIVAT